MNIHRLEYFVAVASTGNFTEAAEVLFTTQSAVSKQIISLEAELNVKLFNRNSRKVILTEEGKRILFYAHDILKPYREMQSTFGGSVNGYNNSKSIRMAAVPVYRIYNTPRLIDSYNDNNSSDSLWIDECEFGEFLNPLLKGDYEMAIGTRELVDEKKFECLSFDHDKLAVVMPRNNPLSIEKTLTMYQLRNEKFVFINKKVGLYDKCMCVCNENGFHPQVMYACSQPQSISKIVEQMGYVCLIMGKIAKTMHSDTIVSIPIENGFDTTLALIRQRDIEYSPSAERFWSHTRAFIL